MGGYKKPQKQLHRDFLYLDDVSIVNALSGMEAGKVDEIIEQSRTSKDSGMDAALGYGPAKIAAKKGKVADVTANLVRTRTAFSAFEAWFDKLKTNDALGELTGWDAAIREELSVGDTFEVRAVVEFAPIHKVLTVYLKWIENANKPDSFLRVTNQELASMKQVARQAGGMLKGADGAMANLVYFAPLGIKTPLIIGLLSDNHFVGDKSSIEGEYKAVLQVQEMLATGKTLAAVRAISDAPRTDIEVANVTESLDGLVEAAKGMGVTIGESDKSFTNPTVIVRPLAIFR